MYAGVAGVREESYRNLSFIQADARVLTFSDESDIIFLNSALHRMSDQKPVIEGIARPLRPGGRMLVRMGGKGNAEPVFVVVNGLVKNPRWKRYFEGFLCTHGMYGSDEYRQWLEEAGFEWVRVDLIPKDTENRDPAGPCMIYPDDLAPLDGVVTLR